MTLNEIGPITKQVRTVRLSKPQTILMNASTIWGSCLTEVGPDIQELTVDKTSIGDGMGNNNVVTRGNMVSGGAAMDKMEAKDARSITGSGAKHPVGKCGHGGGKDLSINCYFRSIHPGVYFDGHIPFTADYPTPQYHPPRNN
jgi:hypothetical protein